MSYGFLKRKRRLVLNFSRRFPLFFSEEWWHDAAGYTDNLLKLVTQAHGFRTYMTKPMTNRFPDPPDGCPENCYVRARVFVLRVVHKVKFKK